MVKANAPQHKLIMALSWPLGRRRRPRVGRLGRRGLRIVGVSAHAVELASKTRIRTPGRADANQEGRRSFKGESVRIGVPFDSKVIAANDEAPAMTAQTETASAADNG